MIAALVIIACAVLNRARGDDRWKPSWLPGRALFYVAPAIAAVALLVQPWPVALVFGAGYAFWAVWGWGHVLMRVGGLKPDRSPDIVEAAILVLPGATSPVFARMAFVFPMVWAICAITGNDLFGAAALAFPAAASVIYRILFRPISSHDWLRAEVAIGCLWGVMILAA